MRRGQDDAKNDQQLRCDAQSSRQRRCGHGLIGLLTGSIFHGVNTLQDFSRNYWFAWAQSGKVVVSWVKRCDFLVSDCHCV